MYEDEQEPESFEDMVRAFAREIGRSAERITQVDVDEIAEAIGIDAEQAKQWADTASRWLRGQFENLGEDVAERARSAARPPERSTPAKPPVPTEPSDDPLRTAGPHPLDIPTDEQGAALAALESGRWTVEPGSNRLVSHGEGGGPSGGLGLVRELVARDWISAEGEVTLVGRHALTRWLQAANRR